MNEEKFKKVRRIAAMIGIVLLVGMYIVAFVAAIGKSENAHAWFLVSLYCTFVVPVIIYVIQMIYKLANKNKDDMTKDNRTTADKNKNDTVGDDRK